MIDQQASLATTRAFWDANPCGVHADYVKQKNQRYAMEPWIPAILHRLGSAHASVLEVGCGQGIDSTLICSALRPGGRYVGIDYSSHSVEVACRNAAGIADQLAVTPEYRVGNAEALEFDDGSFDAVYSLGVIHHTANEKQAIDEVHRVLAAGGTAYIFLYRKYAPKVTVAMLLRALQVGLDFVLGTERCIYRALRQRSSSSRRFGTMFLECFGVPYLKWYSRREIERLFANFARLRVSSVGPNLGSLNVRPSVTGETPLGYFWRIEASK